MFFFTQIGILSSKISNFTAESLGFMRGLVPTWAIWCSRNTPKT